MNDALKIDVVTNREAESLRIVAIDAAGRVGNDYGFDAHARENANGEGDFLHGIAFVQMDAALHASHWDIADIADDETSCVPDGCRLREIWNLRVGDFVGVSEFVPEIAEARTQNQCDARPQLRFAKNEFGGAFGALELHAGLRFRLGRFRVLLCAHEKIPTIEADRRLAIVPASMARIPNLASWPRCSGASAQMPS